MVMLPNEFVKYLHQTNYTQLFYGAGRDLVEGITGKEKNACAAVASAALMVWGVFKVPQINTRDFERQLIATKMFEKYYTSSQIQPTDVLFSEDTDPKNGMPDHVYIAVERPQDDGQCSVFDNYSPAPHLRNLGKGPRTPFAYGYHFKEKYKPLTPIARYFARRAFSLLYHPMLWNRIPESAQQRINIARHHPIFM